MRNILTILLFVLTFTLGAQDRKFVLGINASGVASQVFGDLVGGFHRPGVGFSLSNTVRLSEGKRFRFELGYIQKGSLQWGNANTGAQFYSLSVHYVEVPLIWQIDMFNGAVELGLNLSKNIRLVEKDIYGVFPSYAEANFAELGLILGYQQCLSDNWYINYRYGNSITPMRPHQSQEIRWNNWGQMHSYFQVQLNYSFN